MRALLAHSSRSRTTIALLLASLWLAFFEIDAKGLWLDEVASLTFAEGGARHWLDDHNMALYYGLLAGIVRLFGDGALAVRSLSATCFVGSVCTLRALGASLYGERTGVFAACLFAVNALCVQLAQEARAYTLVVWLCIASSLLLLKLAERPSARAAACYAAVASLAVYAHLFATFVLPAHAACILYAAWRRGLPARIACFSIGATAVLVLPAVTPALGNGTQQIGWLYPPTLVRAFDGLVFLNGDSLFVTLILGALFVVHAAETALALTRKSASALGDLMVQLWFWTPIVLSESYSLFLSPIVHPRYWVVSLPALVLGASSALVRVRWLPFRNLLLVSLAVMSLPPLVFWYAFQERELWREVSHEIAQAAQSGDRVVLDMSSPEAMLYYAQHMATQKALPSLIWPSRAWAFPPASDDAEADVPLPLTGTRIWVVRNRVHILDITRALPGRAPVWRKAFVPIDHDQHSRFADSHGRVITLELWK